MSTILNGLAQLINPSRFSSVPALAAETTQLQKASQISGNPFIGPTSTNKDIYGKNMPVPGGYFAGYYEGKPNIVGRKLFIMI